MIRYVRPLLAPLVAVVLMHSPVLAQAPAAQPAAAAAPVPPTLQKIRASGVIVLAHREASVPFSYLDANQRPIGYALELCEQVVDAVRRELKLPNLRTEYLRVSAAERIPSLLSGRADLECGNTTNTAERRKQVAFTMTHFFAFGRLLVRSDSRVQRLIDLWGQAIVVNRGSTHARELAARIERTGFVARVVEAQDAAEAFALLQQGKVQAYLHDDIVLAALRANSERPEDWRLAAETTSVEPLAIMLRRDDPEFKRLVDTTIGRYMVDGRIQSLWRRWYESPIPPGNRTLGVPMSALMRDQARFPIADDSVR
jgi:glutamate/aspartate transport system substrate-binding protein